MDLSRPAWEVTVNYIWGSFLGKTESGTGMEVVKQVCVLSQMGNGYQNSYYLSSEHKVPGNDVYGERKWSSCAFFGFLSSVQ